MPEGENAKRNGLSLAASVGGMLLVSSTKGQESQVLEGGHMWFWDPVQLFYI